MVSVRLDTLDNRESLTEAMREAELYLDAQLTSALAARQRAVSFVMFLAAASAVMGIISISLLVGEPPKLALAAIGLAMMLGWLMAMLLAIRAASSTQFWYVGDDPAEWRERNRTKMPLEQGLTQAFAHYSGSIDKNRSSMALADRKLMTALKLCWFSLAIGGTLAVTWIVYVLYRTQILHQKWHMLFGS